MGISSSEIESLTESQINYILGDTGRSFVCGFGVNPPQQPHHSGASCPDLPEECDWDEYDNPGPNYQVSWYAINFKFYELEINTKTIKNALIFVTEKEGL